MEMLARAQVAEVGAVAGNGGGVGAPAGLKAGQRPAGAPVPRPELASRAREIVAHLESGAELVDGGMFRVVLAGQVVQSYSTTAARRVLDVPALLREIGPDRWALAA